MLAGDNFPSYESPGAQLFVYQVLQGAPKLPQRYELWKVLLIETHVIQSVVHVLENINLYNNIKKY